MQFKKVYYCLSKKKKKKTSIYYCLVDVDKSEMYKVGDVDNLDSLVAELGSSPLPIWAYL